MSPHTIGPWEVRTGINERSLTIWPTKGYSIAVVPAQTQEGIASARLIAAAPELLAACEDALAFVRQSRMGSGNTEGNLIAAIGKAKGNYILGTPRSEVSD